MLSREAGSLPADLIDYSARILRYENRKMKTSLRRKREALRESEREILHTEVRGLHACNSVVGKFGARWIVGVRRACTASRIFKEQTVETDHSPKTHLSTKAVLWAGGQIFLFSTRAASRFASFFLRSSRLSAFPLPRTTATRTFMRLDLLYTSIGTIVKPFFDSASASCAISVFLRRSRRVRSGS